MDLYREFYRDVLKRNVVPIPLTYVGNQALGWFKQPIKGWDDFKGRKCRQTGITAEVFSRSGMMPVNIPGAEIVPAAERGVIECAEFVGAAEEKSGVKIQHTPDEILRKILESWDQIAKDESAKNPFFKKVYDSQRAYASKVVPTRRLTVPPYEFAAGYYWPEKK